MVQCLSRPVVRMCAVAAIVQWFICGGDHSGSSAARGEPRDYLKLGVPRRCTKEQGWQVQGGGDIGNSLTSGVGDAERRRCEVGANIAAWACQNGKRDSCRMPEIRTDSFGEKDRGHAPVV